MNLSTPRTQGKTHEPEQGHAYLNALLTSLNDPVIGLTTKGIVRSWSPAATRLFGWRAREIVGKSISRITPPEHRTGLEKALRELRGGKPVREFESVGASKDGRRFEISLNYSPVKSMRGTLTDVVVVIRDITRRLRGREAIVRRNRELLTFHTLSQIALSSRSLEESYCDIVDEIRSATGFPIVAIAIVDESRETIAFHGLNGNRSRARRQILEFPLRKTVSGMVVQSGKPLVVTHVSAHPKYRSKVLRQTRAQTFIGYPMKVGGRIIGCLNLAHTDNVEVAQETRQWIEGLANYVAVLTERRRAEEDLRISREQLRELSNRTRSAIEEERKRIAREIHDELGQDLSLLQLDLGLLQSRMPHAEAELQKKAQSMIRLVDSAIKCVQRISSDLRPTLLDNLGLGAAAEWAVNEFQKRTKIRCRIMVYPRDVMLDPQRSTALFRILQEALTNVLRHARATTVKVKLVELDGEVELRVRDNGVGISPLRIKDPKSTGLAGMRERVLPWGGSVTIVGKKPQGTEVIVNVPLKP